jgi:hypothetical protein
MAMLHPNAALRVLRRETVRLNEARLELIEAVDDPRIPAGVARQQIAQCDREIDELIEAHKYLADMYDARRAAA